ncbi:MAG: hypothetical protein MPW14_08325 [Candidatus Manganitrophus sp.]|nr:MAG: hypothetical protein MPW14_08325 [Candidatus Manganitrophus sp.]
MNWEAIDPYLSLRYVPGPKTLFQDITKLMPGHYLLYKEERSRSKATGMSRFERKRMGETICRRSSKRS